MHVCARDLSRAAVLGGLVVGSALSVHPTRAASTLPWELSEFMKKVVVIMFTYGVVKVESVGGGGDLCLDTEASQAAGGRLHEDDRHG